MIPEGWEYSTLGIHLNKVVGGGTPSRANSQYWNGTVPWATVKDLVADELSTTQEFITTDGVKNSATNIVQKGTVITATRMGLGRVIRFTTDVAINQDLKALYPTPSLDQNFLFQWLKSKAVEIKGIGSGSTVKGIRLEALKGLPILLPPLFEQKKIASILSSVDTAIQTTQKVIDQIQMVKQGLLVELLTKGIGHTEFKMTEIGKIPTVWKISKLKDIATNQKGSFSNGPFGSDLLRSDLREAGVPVIYIKDIKNGEYSSLSNVYIEQQKADTLLSSEVQADDILFTKVGDPPCTAAVFPNDKGRAIITQDVIRLRVNKDLILPKFVKAFFDSSIGISLVEKIAIEGTRKRVSLGQFKELYFPVPCIEEQDKISSIISSLEVSIRNGKNKKSQLEQLKKGLMQDLLTGKVRVKV